MDLAGSERLKDTKSEGSVLREAGSINKSLHALGKVISSLSAAADAAARPQRPPPKCYLESIPKPRRSLAPVQEKPNRSRRGYRANFLTPDSDLP